MPTSVDRGQVLRFGVFEADLATGELRRRGVRLRLQDQPFGVLTALLERSGQVVTREELRRRLWPADTFVGFEHSLATAVNKIRTALDDSAANPRFIETLPRRGYRFLVPVERMSEAEGAIDSLAVLPFDNAADDPEIDYLGDGLVESVILSLSPLAGVRVMARSTVFRYRQRPLDAIAAGRELNVRAVLTGRVARRGSRLQVGVELVDVNDGSQLWGEQYGASLADLPAVEVEIAEQISRKLRLRLTREEETRLSQPQTHDATAYGEYLKGRYYAGKLNGESLQKAIACFRQAIERDPHYAAAHAGLAACFNLMGFVGLLAPRDAFPPAQAAAERALQLDDALSEAHAVMASVRKLYEWDWPGAEREYQRALELNPNYATAHQWYGDFLSAMGRPEEALREIHRAQELDPLSLQISVELAWNFFMARDHRRALEHCQRTLEMEADFAPAHLIAGLASEQLARADEALAAFRRAREAGRSNPATLAALGHGLASSGAREEAVEILSLLRAPAEPTYVAPYWSAVIHAGLGEAHEALDCLERAYAERDVWLVWAAREPRFDSLRGEPRFAALLSRLGFAR